MDDPRDDQQTEADWGDEPERRTEEGISLVVDVGAFEGPLDVLLALARDQKVDLLRISIVALADQYLAFIEEARRQNLDLAVDYLVMAAWLAYLKSRLLLPVQPDDDEPSAEEMAEQLARRLRRLEAIRDVAARLMNRGQLGRDIFQRGAPETRETRITKVWDDTLYDLLTAYSAHRRRIEQSVLHIEQRSVWSLAEARRTLIRLIGDLADWLPLETFLAPYLKGGEDRATVLASSFSASLELAREGEIELHQAAAFQPLYIRSRTDRDSPAAPSTGEDDRG